MGSEREKEQERADRRKLQHQSHCYENMVFKRLLKLSVLGKITVEKFRDFGVLFESGIIMTREALHPMILCAFSWRIKQTDDFDGIFMLCEELAIREIFDSRI